MLVFCIFWLHYFIIAFSFSHNDPCDCSQYLVEQFPFSVANLLCHYNVILIQHLNLLYISSLICIFKTFLLVLYMFLCNWFEIQVENMQVLCNWSSSNVAYTRSSPLPKLYLLSLLVISVKIFAMFLQVPCS